MGARAGREEQGESGDRGGIASPASSRGAGASEGERVGKIPARTNSGPHGPFRPFSLPHENDAR
nr:MAG TPA: hypothetical protein [Caudoviricetes sp.]